MQESAGPQGSHMNRQAMLAELGNVSRPRDVAVIGGGATGLGAALDAASRGYSVALFEADDFAKGTSSRSTKLIHGGVRYLRQGQIKMVRESLLERGRLRRNAPHIVHSRSFVIPAYDFMSRYYFFAGMKTYDLLAGQLGFEPSRLLSKQQTLDLLPTLAEHGPQGSVRGGVLYSDGQFDDARLAIALAQTLVEQGGLAVNYTRVVRLLKTGGRITGLVARDLETNTEFEVPAKVVVNATGVFGEAIMRLDADGESSADQPASAPVRIVASQGTHIVLPHEFLDGPSAMLIPHTDDSRVLFAIPWHGKSLIGTTDNRVLDISLEPRPLAGEIDYLLEHVGRYLARQPTTADVLSVFSGLRPLVGQAVNSAQGGKQKLATSKLSREHQILTSASGLITVIGGKWTTYRKMGEDVIDLAAQVAGLNTRPSATAELPLHGSPQSDSGAPNTDPWQIYGTDRAQLLELAEQETNWSARLDERLDIVAAQVVWAVEHEMARTVEDVLSRRTRSLLLDAKAAISAAEKTARLMQPLLGQTPDWVAEQVQAFHQLAQGYLPIKTNQ